ncbi:MAG: 4Fe-4S binding protein [Thermodesulfobacteriota bacterium]
MARPDFVIGLIKKVFVRDMKKASVTRLPLVGRVVESLLFEGDHLICLPNDRVVEVNRDLDGKEQMALPSALAEHYVDRASHRFLMDFCICRKSMGCKDYPEDFGCLFLGEPVLSINPGWGRLVSPEEAKAHLKRCRDKGLVHFVGRSKLDTVWLGIGPGDRLFTICSCCPCCCITRAVPYVSESLAEKIHRAPGVTVTVSDDCAGCGACARNVCFCQAITISDGRAVISDECRGCGRCVSVCPSQAISVNVDFAVFEKQSLADLAGKVNL